MKLRVEILKFQKYSKTINLENLHVGLCMLTCWGGNDEWAVAMFMYQSFPLVFLLKQAARSAKICPRRSSKFILFINKASHKQRKNICMWATHSCYFCQLIRSRVAREVVAILHVCTLLMCEYFGCLSQNHLRLHFWCGLFRKHGLKCWSRTASECTALACMWSVL